MKYSVFPLILKTLPLVLAKVVSVLVPVLFAVEDEFDMLEDGDTNVDVLLLEAPVDVLLAVVVPFNPLPNKHKF